MPTPARKPKITTKTVAQSKADKYISANGKKPKGTPKASAPATPGVQGSEYYLDGQTYDPPAKSKGGRPPLKFDPLVARVLLEEISQGETSIRQLLENRKGFYPSRATLWKWLQENPEFRAQYQQAKAEQIDSYVDDTVHLADNAKPDNTNVVSLQIKARQWQAERLKPKVYGNQVQIEQTVTQANPMMALMEQMTPEEREQLRQLVGGVMQRAQTADAATRTAQPRQLEGKAKRRA